MEFLNVPVAMIDCDPQQPRTEFDEQTLRELADSIGSYGMLQPIIVRPVGNRYALVVGERRVRAARLLGMEAVPALERTADADNVGIIQLIENIHRDSLSLADRGRAVSHVVNTLGFAAACERLCRSPAWVSKHATLNTMPPPVAEAVANGDIRDADTAHELKRIHELSPSLARQMVDSKTGLTRAAVRTARADIEAQRDEIAESQTLRADQLAEIGRGFMRIMSNHAMAPNAKFVALLDLYRKAGNSSAESRQRSSFPVQ